MEMEELEKRIKFLETQHQKDRLHVEELEQRLGTLENQDRAKDEQVNALESNVTYLLQMQTNFDVLEVKLQQLQADLTRQIQNVDQQRQDHDRDVDRSYRSDQDTVNRSIVELRKPLETIPEFRKGLQVRQEEDFRLAHLIEELEKKVDDAQRFDEEYKRSLRLLDEGRRQDMKRLVDLQGEVAAQRKRVDEQRGKVDVSSESTRKLEMRLNELQGSELERRQAQSAFLERQNLLQVERERAWRDILIRFEDISKQAGGLDTQLQSLDATHRAITRSQEAFDEITQRFERRLNEITEMQRLVEERFRQEWVTFKADDQKRWMNFALAEDGQQSETSRMIVKINEHLASLDDMSQEMRDQLHQILSETEKILQTNLAKAQEWVESNSRTFGSSNTPRS